MTQAEIMFMDEVIAEFYSIFIQSRTVEDKISPPYEIFSKFS